MYRFILSVTMVVSLAAAAGCGAHGARHSAVPAGSNVADVSKDPSWCPPGEELSFEGARESASAATVKHGDVSEVTTEIKPNAAKRPSNGAVHAAVY